MRVTIEQLGMLVSERREEWREFDNCGSIEVIPRYDYATDDAAAMRLFSELPFPRVLREDDGGRVTVWHSDFQGKWAKTRPVAICLAWRKWKTGEDLEVVE